MIYWRNRRSPHLPIPVATPPASAFLATELDGKRQEILLEAVPLARRLALLVDPAVTAPHQLDALQDIAKARGITVSAHKAANSVEIMPAIDAAVAAGAQALNVLASSLFNRYRPQIIERMAAIRIPAIYQWPEMAEEGGHCVWPTLCRALSPACTADDQGPE